MGYAGFVEKMEKETGKEITEIDRPELWTRARVDELGKPMNEEVEGISQKNCKLTKIYKLVNMYAYKTQSNLSQLVSCKLDIIKK